jgi:3-methyl-2-oxobutanoate hydroxymethyltransferase
MSQQTGIRRTTVRDLRRRKASGRRITMLTAYDATMAALLERGGVDLILVGDSVGNTMLGYSSTIPVTMEAMLHHASAVVRGTSQALVVFDLPFGAATDPETALQNGIRALQQAGAHAVKIEGDASAAPIVARLTQQGIPVMAHIGLQPQQVHQLGGYPRFGRTPEQARALLESAKAIEAAGAFAVVLECVEPEVAAGISQALSIPTIGIGSGPACDGQVLVINDLIGLSLQPPPSFARPRAQVASIIEGCVRDFVHEVSGPTRDPEAAGHA